MVKIFIEKKPPSSLLPFFLVDEDEETRRPGRGRDGCAVVHRWSGAARARSRRRDRGVVRYFFACVFVGAARRGATEIDGARVGGDGLTRYR